ncbi:MAG: hypothetical protein RL417_2476, partial [Pseudomonadota bacterium]
MELIDKKAGKSIPVSGGGLGEHLAAV